MAGDLAFRRPRLTDVNRIARAMAPIDVVECAASGHSPRQALLAGLSGSQDVWTAVIDGRPAAMFGVTPLSVIGDEGAPWLLGTEAARLQRRAFLRIGRAFIATCHERFSFLTNYVSVANAPAIRYLERLGFTVEPETVYANGEAMRRFWRSV